MRNRTYWRVAHHVTQTGEEMWSQVLHMTWARAFAFSQTIRRNLDDDRMTVTLTRIEK